ncbi:MAG: hypothetical protein N2512_09080 [Armatimonadetes bacterium]|nr:hypothetical protein [Armatimonadota bacterium]
MPVGKGQRLAPAGMLTNWGLGMCAVTAGGGIGMALAMCLHAEPGSGTVLAWMAGPATGGALAASWLGKHLMRPARRCFERLMIALVFAALPWAAITVAVWRNPYFLCGGVVTAALAVYSYLRRLPPEWGLSQADSSHSSQ